MLSIVIKMALIGFAVSSFILLVRVIKGPSTPDRVIALDAMGINLIAITGLMSMLLATTAYLDVILLLGILSFIGTVAFSKFLEKGVIVEYERNR
ncbi:Na(+)/H(+) antiporter subunit F1 [Siminovitchia acidinfaciens]|uniref:Na(+)/H(+) antiporter subunit F1 n=2 Tax=Siminovitchia acidinfaciens TaxID=2321395 RepID=A0A429Y8F2_9BACI|nr:Na(+)/H(+) antiporter subunit F1 [Siminovitchia acidinfaciens]RST77668.1 Na(+)/H(+) antiporter subunit F1 [Siminovitchia acidinfaciens]VEF47111.1 monovalent cation/H+ antiporter subunit F [Bacillus freudenreichii]